MTTYPTRNERHLRVYENRSEYVFEDGKVAVFPEGTLSSNAKRRIKEIKTAFEGGFLDHLIDDIKTGKGTVDVTKVSDVSQKNIRELVDSLTSEVGRALIGLTVMQMSIKTISPEQSIRLHKASANLGSFSWVEGVSMRTLDKTYVTPTLRHHDLVRLNADGFMMTRSLAENYPYSSLYKAQLRGAREQWLAIVEELELGQTDPEESLKFLIALLLNAAASFDASATELIALLEGKIGRFESRSNVVQVMKSHADSSDYAARLLEISMHALMQAAVDSGALGDVALKPLSQMRSANKKHGNIGDIELLEDGDIVESWDAKYGKPYLREEIEEASEKIQRHGSVLIVGFVTDVGIQRSEEMERRIDELSALHGVKFSIVRFEDWAGLVYERCLESLLINEETLSKAWIRAYTLTLSQRKRSIAPIDEPCAEWVRLLHQEIEKV